MPIISTSYFLSSEWICVFMTNIYWIANYTSACIIYVPEVFFCCCEQWSSFEQFIVELKFVSYQQSTSIHLSSWHYVCSINRSFCPSLLKFSDRNEYESMWIVYNNKWNFWWNDNKRLLQTTSIDERERPNLKVAAAHPKEGETWHARTPSCPCFETQY